MQFDYLSVCEFLGSGHIMWTYIHSTCNVSQDSHLPPDLVKECQTLLLHSLAYATPHPHLYSQVSPVCQ